jgi:hypothetical protein
VTIHRTPIAKATPLFLKQAGRLLKPCFFDREEPELIEGESDCEEDLSKAHDVLEKLEQHEINLNCGDFKLANYEIVIDGLGWISVQGQGMATFILHLPPNVNFHIRDDPMRPHVVQDRRLMKFTGNTVNANTRRNKPKSHKY